MNLLWRLLKQHISVAQFAGFFLANLVGVVIILLGVQFYNDIQAVYNGADSFMKADYMIVNKQVGALTTITGKSSVFTDDEIKDIESQRFVKKIGRFTSSAFSVHASFDIKGFTGISTDMFFESVPDDFVDVKSSQWGYKPGSKNIPIILPKNYLDLYNFGYAQGKGLPQLSEGILGAMALKINIGGNDNYEGRIVGFSSRLNTILVPEAFMQWANQHYRAKAAEVTRVIMEVDNPTDDNITKFLQENNYETDADKLDASKTTYMLRVLVSVVMGVGFVISILSLYILMLSVFLLVQKNSQKLENLLLIGYSPAKVSLPYQILTIGLNALVLILALALMLIIRSIYLAMLESFFPNLVAPTILPAIIVGVVLFIAVSIFNVVVVYGKVMNIWQNKQ